MPFQWKTPSQIFDNMVGRLRHLSAKPIGIMETAADPYYDSDVPNVAAKNSWIPTVYSYARSMGIKMIIWFNENPQAVGPQCCSLYDWRVFNGFDGDTQLIFSGKTYINYSYYATTVKLWWLSAADPTNSRLLTDAQFTGIL